MWRPKLYGLILLAARGHLPGEALDFYVGFKHASPASVWSFSSVLRLSCR
jgi:hypothetical protein